MGMILIFVVVLAILVVAANRMGNKKQVSGKCKTCPEYPYCGGGRPRCARRSGSV